MSKKIIMALVAALALVSSAPFDSGANARPPGSDCGGGSAYAVPRC